MTTQKAIFCWSGGKDSAYCLHKVLTEQLFHVCYLLTTVSEPYQRVSMHGVRLALLQQQAATIGIPLITVSVSEGTNNEYEQKMESAMLRAKEEGIEHIIFGDIFLEDLRAYREANLAKVGMKGVFPLWQRDTSLLIKDFIAQGFKTIICCTNDAYMGQEWAGRDIDEQFVFDLPPNVDPCGENGEYHTFCYDGPLFKEPVPVTRGEIIYRALEIKTTDDCTLPASMKTKGFWFCDLLLIKEISMDRCT